jgi:hypothetical protein
LAVIHSNLQNSAQTPFAEPGIDLVGGFPLYIDDDVAAKARHAPRGPDFICLGAQKAATTWLYEVLKRQHGIYMPPIKEVHYFSQLYNLDARRYGPAHRAQQVTALRSYLVGRAPQSSNNLKILHQLEHLEAPEVDDIWYAKIFRDAKNSEICGEICPSYMNLPTAGVSHVLGLNPFVKLLVLVRDPVERCWSHIRMHVSQGIMDKSLAGLLDGSTSLGPYLFYTDYAGSLSRWRSFARQEQISVVLHDDILFNSEAALGQILQFFGMALPQPNPDVRRTVFRGEDITMPATLRRKLLEALEPQYEYLSKDFPIAVARWKKKHLAEIEYS